MGKEQKQRLIAEEIGQRRWRCIEHTLRKPGNNVAGRLCNGTHKVSGSRARPQATWKRCIDKDQEKIVHGWYQLPQIAQDRERWKLLVHALYPDRDERL